MIDLDEWARRQKATLRFAEQMAIYRLSQRYGWGLPHPFIKQFTQFAESVRDGFTGIGKIVKKQHDIIVEAFDIDNDQRIVAIAPRNGATPAHAESIAFTHQHETEL